MAQGEMEFCVLRAPLSCRSTCAFRVDAWLQLASCARRGMNYGS